MQRRLHYAVEIRDFPLHYAMEWLEYPLHNAADTW